MSDREIFAHAPIQEAVLDIRVELTEELAVPDLDSAFHALIRDRFPKSVRRNEWQLQFEVDEHGHPHDVASSEGAQGFLYRSIDESKIVQARLNGFAFSKLRPYETWEGFCGEAQELWATYQKVAQPKRVTRLALRYINRIELPLPLADLKEYILTVPEIAPALPQALATFLTRLVIPDTESDSVVIITETVPQSNEPSTVSFIFDIDAYKVVELRPESDQLWDVFETLHEVKNRFFFGSITEKAKELFR